MKKSFLYFTFLINQIVFCQSNNFIHTSSKYILGPCNDTLTLRGVNYAPYNWGYNSNDLKIDQIAMSGANSVRIVWYQNNPDQSTLYDNLVYLDSVLSKCIQYKLIPVIELHDFTCQNNVANLSQSSSFWTNPDLVTILNKYKHSLILNIANEALYVNWSGNFISALNTYKTTYQNIITSLRNVVGFGFPIMIDAPDCGQTSDVFIASNTAQSLIDFDPEHNLIFSAHAYWYGYANNDSTQMATKIDNVLAANIPFVLGEIANQQDDATMCQYDLNYQALLNHCQLRNVSWLAWSWDHDGCPQRQMSTNGNFNSLTTYGNDIINNSNYGLSNGVLKSEYLENNGCSTNSVEQVKFNEKFNIFPNPSETEIYVQNLISETSYEIININGKTVSKGLTDGLISISNLEKGVYYVLIKEYKFKLIKQ